MNIYSFSFFCVNRKKQPESFSFCVEGGEKGSVKVLQAKINIQILFTNGQTYLTTSLLAEALFLPGKSGNLTITIFGRICFKVSWAFQG